MESLRKIPPTLSKFVSISSLKEEISGYFKEIGEFEGRDILVKCLEGAKTDSVFLNEP